MLIQALLERAAVRSIANQKFWKWYAKMPAQIQQAAKDTFNTWKADPWQSNLQFKKTYAPGDVWSCRIGNTGYRALAIRKSSDTWEWFWIGSHADYDKILDKR